MWRKNAPSQNHDSDQSISEEENLEDDWSANYVSMGCSKEKGKLHVLSQLEMLRDAGASAAMTTTSLKKGRSGLCLEDEVEISACDNAERFACYSRMAYKCNLDEEFISDDEKIIVPTFGGVKRDGEDTWFAVKRETEALVHLNENNACSSSHIVPSKSRMSGSKVGKGKSKPTFSFRFNRDVSCEDETMISSQILPLQDEILSIEQNHTENLTGTSLEVFRGQQIAVSQIYAMPPEGPVGLDTEHSMAELLDIFQEKNGLPQCNSEKNSRNKGRRVELVNRTISLMGDRQINDPDPPEALDNGTSTDDEDGHQNLKLIIPESKEKSMADQFQEAFGALSSMETERKRFALPGQSSIGLFGKLQQVIQSEKELDMDFLKRLQTETFSHEATCCIDVRIMSRCLEAKLTVCSCSISGDTEGSQRMENTQMRNEVGGRTSTIIFSSRVCSDVELEVGNMIRVYPPWKEVHAMGENEITILSTYFSQI